MKNLASHKEKCTTLITLSVLGLSCQAAFAEINAKNPAFDSTLLWGESLKSLDLSKYNETGNIPEGVYSIDIQFNETSKGRYDLQVASLTGEGKKMPCVTRKLLLSFGVKPSSLKPANANSTENTDINECIDITKYIKNASYQFNSNDLSLNISIPQIDLINQARDYIPPERWDSGIPALLLDYTGNTYYSKNSNNIAQSTYFNTKLGLNIGDWQFRNTTSLTWDKNTGRSVTPQESYLKRDIDSLHSQLVLGDSFTDGDLFDSVSIRGIRLFSDDRMKPSSATGYAPVVRGMASTNAKVTIKQNGYIIAETTVSPGAFEISDISPSSNNGDLQVTVTEADGRTNSFTVPFSAVARSLREGADRFNVALGQVRQLNNSQPWLGQLTYQRGLSNLLTVTTGFTGSDGYSALQLGSVFNTAAGAIGVEMTSSQTQLADMKLSGQSYRLSFNKLFDTTGTNLTLAAYRYSTSGYFSVRDALSARDQIITNKDTESFVANYGRVRSRAELNINQPVGKNNSIYLSGSVQSYWDWSNNNTQLQAGYRKNLNWGSISLDLSRQRDLRNKAVDSAMITLSLNLDKGKTFNSSLQHDTAGNSNAMLSTSGSMDDSQKWNYSFTAMNSKSEGSNSNNSLAGNISHQGNNANVNISASANRAGQQMSLGVAGAIVATSKGIFFGQSLGDSAALIEAPDAEGAEVMPGIGVQINKAGYALLPSLSSYRINDIQLQTTNMDDGVELDYSGTQIVPRSGAIVLTKFKTSKGYPLMLKAAFSDGSPLPFGARVKDKAGNVVGDIGQAGKLLARVKQEKGTLFISIAEGKNCSFNYAIDSNTNQKTIQPVTCHMAQ